MMQAMCLERFVFFVWALKGNGTPYASFSFQIEKND